MLNNKGLGKFELLTVLVLLMAIGSFFGYIILQGADNQKFKTMKNSALSFSNAVTTNIASFHYTDVVYLEEAVEEKVFPSIKNPFGKGSCDSTQSRVDTVDGKTYTTLKCGDYLIDNASLVDPNSVIIYRVSDWSPNKPDGEDFEERVLYNCLDGEKEVFDQYYEELFFVHEYNKKYGTDIYFANGVSSSNCEVVSKTFYRTHALADEKKS